MKTLTLVDLLADELPHTTSLERQIHTLTASQRLRLHANVLRLQDIVLDVLNQRVRQAREANFHEPHKSKQT